MQFFNPHTGEMHFPCGLCLRGGIPAEQIDPNLRALPGEDTAFCLPHLAVEGGALAPVCTLGEGGLAAVRLTAVSVNGRQQTPGERQRAFLFGLFGLKDPCPDTQQPVRIRAPFGHLTLYTDPVSGQAGALVEYVPG